MGRQPKSSTGGGGASLTADASGSAGTTNYALELDPTHRRNLASSLDRCDVEIAALDRLHVTLRTLRGVIVERYGELALFPTRTGDGGDPDGGGDGHTSGDGAEGSNKAKKNVEKDADEKKEEVDGERERLLEEFRLRMKLRRRLLNRLSRRLNRLAHMMDGETVVPPQPPKYGDMRYKVDKARRDEFLESKRRRDEALAELRNRARVRAVECPGSLGGDGGEDGTAALASALSSPMVDGERERALRDAIVEYEPVVVADGGGAAGDGAPGGDEAAAASSSDVPEYAAIKYGAGIGAAHRSMSNREKEADYVRWKADILARVPEQPTFAELGMGDDVVFREEERRRRIMEKLRPKKEEKVEQDEDQDESEDEEEEEEDGESKSNTEIEDDNDTEASESASQSQADEEDENPGDGENDDALTNEAKFGGSEESSKVPAEADSDAEMEESDGVVPMRKSDVASAEDGITRAGEGDGNDAKKGTAVVNAGSKMEESDRVEAKQMYEGVLSEDGGADVIEGVDDENSKNAKESAIVDTDADVKVGDKADSSRKSDDDNLDSKTAVVDTGTDLEGSDKVQGNENSDGSLTEDKTTPGGKGGDGNAEKVTALIDGDAEAEGRDEKGEKQTADAKSKEESTEEKSTLCDEGDYSNVEKEIAATGGSAEKERGDKVETRQKSDDADKETAPADAVMEGSDDVNAFQKSEKAEDKGTHSGEDEGKGKGSDDKSAKEAGVVEAIADAKTELRGSVKLPLQPLEEVSGRDNRSSSDNDKTEEPTDVVADADATDPDAETKHNTMAEAGTRKKTEDVVVDDESGGGRETGKTTNIVADSVATETETEDTGNAPKVGKEQAAEASVGHSSGSNGDDGHEGTADKDLDAVADADAAPGEGTAMDDGLKMQSPESVEVAHVGLSGEAVHENNEPVDEDVDMEDADKEEADPANSEQCNEELGDDSAKAKDASDEDGSSEDDDEGSKSEAGGDADVEMEDSQKDASESEESNDENEQEEGDENATPKKGKGHDEDKDTSFKKEASPRSMEKKDESPKKQKRSAEANELPKKKARLSLLPVPSFANQDLRRIRAIQADLVYASMSEQVRTRLAEVTNEYNSAVKASTDLQNLKHRAQSELNRIMLANRNAAHKKKRDYALEVAIARAKWQRDREIWDGKSNARKVKRQQLAEQEAAYVQRALRIPDSIVRTSVGYTLMDVVSAVERQAQQLSGGAQRPGGIWATYINENEEFESFVPPSMDGQDGGSLDPNRLSKQQEEEEAQKRKEIYHVTLKFNAAEEERKRVWRKMLKIKAEFDPAASRGRGAGGGAIVDVPLPVLRGSGKVYAAQQLPQYTPLSPAQVAATVKKRVPATRQPRAEGGSAPGDKYKGKYSIDRVKERIFPDGSVMPVQMPKKNKDGLYQRPAGRRRKGMEWDAVMGRWIPTGS